MIGEVRLHTISLKIRPLPVLEDEALGSQPFDVWRGNGAVIPSVTVAVKVGWNRGRALVLIGVCCLFLLFFGGNKIYARSLAWRNLNLVNPHVVNKEDHKVWPGCSSHRCTSQHRE